MYLLLLIISICLAQNIKRSNLENANSLCSNPAREMVLKFDEIPVPTAEGYNGGLVQPYNGYVFKRVNTPYAAYTHDYVPVLNTSNPIVGSAYSNVSVSTSNVLLSTGESLSIARQAGGDKRFTLLSFYSTSIYLNNMLIFINSFNNGVLVNRTTAVLPLQVPTQIMVNVKNVDIVLIGCVNPDYNNCYPFVYDNFDLC